MSNISYKDYIHCLEPWVKASEKYSYRCPEKPELECYGYGDSGHWAVQTNMKAFAAYAVLATDPKYNQIGIGMSQDELLEKAFRTLRFALKSHLVGGYHCTDGKPWGHSWITALGIERMMHGVEALWEHLTDEDHALLKNLLISEADWLLDHHEIVAGPVKNNVPESNLWNGALLHRTALMYPDILRADEYREKGSRFLINAISIPEDEVSSEVVDGKAVSEWYVGNNFFNTYALNHHGYLNVGYMVICLSNAAMLHFTGLKRGVELPDALYHHAYDLWKVVKQFVFPDGRLIRIGGDTRVRYCYCQDYAIPMWLMMAQHHNDTDCVAFEAGWLKKVQKEIDYNNDGSYLSKRCQELEPVSPVYYTRLESDRAASISMGAYWRREFGIPDVIDKKPNIERASWYDDYHGASFQRDENRVVSWTWYAAEKPQGLCLALDKSDLAEWKENLAGSIRGLGGVNFQDVVSSKQVKFEGGFLTWGTTVTRSQQMVAEGHSNEDIALQMTVFAALPDGQTAVGMQYAQTTPRRTHIVSSKGMCLQIPNDLFNNNVRTYHSVHGADKLQGYGSPEGVVDLDSNWLNIDDSLGVIGICGAKELSIHRPGRRQIGLKHNLIQARSGGMLYADEVCYNYCLESRPVEPNAVLYDIAYCLQAGVSHEYTKEYAEKQQCRVVATTDPAIRAVVVKGKDGRDYLLIVNLGEETVHEDIRELREVAVFDLAVTEYHEGDLICEGKTAMLFRLDRV